MPIVFECGTGLRLQQQKHRQQLLDRVYRATVIIINWSSISLTPFFYDNCFPICAARANGNINAEQYKKYLFFFQKDGQRLKEHLDSVEHRGGIYGTNLSIGSWSSEASLEFQPKMDELKY